jgi:hypothetical protein
MLANTATDRSTTLRLSHVDFVRTLGSMKSMDSRNKKIEKASVKKAKVAISMSPSLLAKVKARTKHGEAKSVSAYIEHAVASQLAAVQGFDDELAALLRGSGGFPTAKERKEARRLLGLAA